LSRRPFRGAALADGTLEVPLRPTPPVAVAPETPDGVLAAARAEAEGLLAAARAEADAVLEAARLDGERAGRAEGLASVEGAVAAASEMALALHARRQALEEAAVGEATALAVEIAAKLVRAEVAARPERIADVLRGAIRRAADRSRLVARVNPRDLATCRAAVPVVIDEMGGIAGLEVIDDPRIDRGSCVLETATGDVDATFESQLARVLEALRAPPDGSLVS
jgi:flagellar assembly protein FliH